MGTVQKFLMGLVGIGLVTTLVLPGRQSTQVIGAVGDKLISNPLRTAING